MRPAARRTAWRVRCRRQLDHVSVDDQLAGILEIDGDAVADHRLDLAQSPVGPLRVAHEVAGRKQGVTGFLEQVFVILGYGFDSRRVNGNLANLAYMVRDVIRRREP